MISKKQESKRAELDKQFRFHSIIGNHSKMIEILELVSQIANTEATVIVYGETGTGKELIATAIHENSYRRKMPFIPLNCGALSENLLESELFGYTQGAFTGANFEKKGWLYSANGGTLFLDEIHEMSPALQVKLLRVLQTGEYAMVGGRSYEKCNMRIIAATNNDLRELISEKKFRGDLFYRLNVIDISMPSLRERRHDIPLLISCFITEFSEKYNKIEFMLREEITEFLHHYSYPGNIRELRNIIERMVILYNDGDQNSASLPSYLINGVHSEPISIQLSSFKEAKKVAIEKFERVYLTQCLKESRGNMSQAARKAGIHVTHFYSKIKAYNIEPYHFKAAVR